MSELTNPEQQLVVKLIQQSFQEDLAGQHDLTTDCLVPDSAKGKIQVVARTSGVLAGNSISKCVFTEFDQSVRYSLLVEDGTPISTGTVIAEVEGAMRSLLTAERTALNFLTFLSGIATLTRSFVDAVAGTNAHILDTRKTLPGLRALQKYAVRCGGGVNHRIGLYDAVLIKDNHLAWWKQQNEYDLASAVEHARNKNPENTTIEIEVDTLSQFQSVLKAVPDIILLDNMTTDQLSEAVQIRNAQSPTVLLEASGGISLDTVAGIAATGVDRISVGALTHSAPALDIGFDWSQSGA